MAKLSKNKHRKRIQEIAESIKDGTCQNNVRAYEDLIIELAEIQPAQIALEILKKFNRLKNDTDAYLYEIILWGLGESNNKPNPEDYGISTKGL